MKITKYPQSCLLIEEGDTRVVIDPGTIFTNSYDADELGEIEAVLYTHQHQDHLDVSLLDGFAETGVRLIANQATADVIGDDFEVEIVSDGDSLEIGDLQITAHELPHVLMIDGSEGPQNTGYIINGNFFHPGDGLETEDLQVENLALPMAGPDVSPKDLMDFAQSVGAQTLIPIHNDVFVVDAKIIASFAEKFNLSFNWVHLADGESLDI